MYQQYLTLAQDAAKAAGQLQREGLRRVLKVETKSGPADLVTEVDHACEAEITGRILAAYSDHRLLAEEGTIGGSNPDWCWLIDPLDGTTNYTHRFPYFSASIGLEYRGELVMGVVYDPVKDEMFWASAGGGAFLNGEPIRVSSVAQLRKALLCSGYPGDKADDSSVVLAWQRLSLQSHGVRRNGSAALDLCNVACGRFDGFWEPLNPWDMAAGVLIVREAGGTLTNFSGGPFDLYRQEIIASNGRIGAEMVSSLKAG